MLLSRYVEHYEYALISSEASVQLSNLEELLPWRRRCARSQQRLCLLRVFIESHLQDIHNEKFKSIWTPVLQDIDHFSSQISNWASFLGSMVSQLDTHQSLIEARSVRRFTYVVLAFTALSLVTSVFSMTDEVLPWGSRFWVYIIIAVPFTLFVLLGYFTLSRNLGRA
jgi:Mg2+ and Co2+ transporter CorA